MDYEKCFEKLKQLIVDYPNIYGKLSDYETHRTTINNGVDEKKNEATDHFKELFDDLMNEMIDYDTNTNKTCRWNDEDDRDASYNTIRCYFTNDKRLSWHLINSYEKFIRESLQEQTKFWKPVNYRLSSGNNSCTKKGHRLINHRFSNPKVNGSKTTKHVRMTSDSEFDEREKSGVYRNDSLLLDTDSLYEDEDMDDFVELYDRDATELSAEEEREEKVRKIASSGTWMEWAKSSGSSISSSSNIKSKRFQSALSGKFNNLELSGPVFSEISFQNLKLDKKNVRKMEDDEEEKGGKVNGREEKEEEMKSKKKAEKNNKDKDTKEKERKKARRFLDENDEDASPPLNSTQKTEKQPNPNEMSVMGKTYGIDVYMDISVTLKCNHDDADLLKYMDEVHAEEDQEEPNEIETSMTSDGMVSLRKVHAKVNMGMVPILLGSSLDPYYNDDTFYPYGNCVVDGQSKFFVSQEVGPKDQLMIASKTKDTKVLLSGKCICNYSGDYTGAYNKLYLNIYKANEELHIGGSDFNEVPMGVMLVALGATSEERIAKICLPFLHLEGGEEKRSLVRQLFQSVINPLRSALHMQTVSLTDNLVFSEDIIFDQKMCCVMLGKASNSHYKNKKRRYYAQNSGAVVEEDQSSPNYDAIKVEELRKQEEKSGKNLINYRFLPSIKSGNATVDDECKLETIGSFTQRMLKTKLGYSKSDDKDYFGNKRSMGPGEFLQLVFYNWKQKASSELIKRLGKYASGNIKGSILSNERRILLGGLDNLTGAFRKCIVTGNFPNGSGGVTQECDNFSFFGKCADVRRSYLSMPKQGKNQEPRRYHSSSKRRLCSDTTPEGEACGLAKHMCLGCEISTGSSFKEVIDLVSRLNSQLVADQMTINYQGEKMNEDYTLLINGMCRLRKQDYENLTFSYLCNVLREARRECNIHYQVSVAYDPLDRCVRITTDAGRYMAPAFLADFVMDKGIMHQICKQVCDSQDPTAWELVMVKNGYVEYLDVLEEDLNSRVAMFPREVRNEYNALEGRLDSSIGKYTHCEIHPSLNLSVLLSIMPFSSNNPPVRKAYGAGMRRQFIGSLAPGALTRFDNWIPFLYYPQRSGVRTVYMDALRLDRVNDVQVSIVGIATQDGENVEDSLVMNGDVIHRGGFRNMSLKGLTETDSDQSCTLISRPPKGNQDPPASDQEIEEDGFVTIGHPVSPNGVIIGKSAYAVGSRNLQNQEESTVGKKRSIPKSIASYNNVLPVSRNESMGYIDEIEKSNLDMNSEQILIKKDVSKRLKNAPIGRTGIEKVCLQTTDDRTGRRMVKVRTSHVEIPEPGDKFASVHGQKGVIGSIRRGYDMPVCFAGKHKGLVPHIIMNPHGIPSRMTIGQMIEALCGQEFASTGKDIDATAFETGSIEERLSYAMKCTGMSNLGSLPMIDGRTGQRWQGRMFIGPTSYMRLRHLVTYKDRVRSIGSIDAITHAPVRGRKLGGGIRFGEMERDVGLANGVANFMRERLQASSMMRYWTCKKCGSCETISGRELAPLDDPGIVKFFNELDSQLADSNDDMHHYFNQHILEQKQGAVFRCKRCNKEETRSGSSLVMLDISYPMKLLIQEFFSFMIMGKRHFVD